MSRATSNLWMAVGLGVLGGCASSGETAPTATAVNEPVSDPSAGAETLPQAEASETDTMGETSAPPGSPGTGLDAALAGAHRSAENRARDAYRHPKETLSFFGLTPGMQVIELAPGGGWYTEILAPVACDGGKLYATMPDPNGPQAKYAKALTDKLASDPAVFECVEAIVFDPPAQASLGAPGSVDMVLTFRSTHGWINRDQAEAVYKAAFDVLKPGGVFGVVQHRAEDGQDAKTTAKSGYVPEPYVIELATAAGFTLADRSDINRNPKDTHDHPEGVWTLPPVLRLGETDRAKYEAIGESDRMTLKFVKPGA